VPGVLGDVDDSLEDKVDEGRVDDDEERDWEPVVAPIPSRNPMFGWMIGVPAMLMYKPSFAEPEDRVWISGLFGFYAENESWGAGLRRVVPDLYFGLRCVYAETVVGPKLPDVPLPPGLDPDRLTVDLTLATIAPRLQYDMRDNEFCPRSGLLVDATAGFSREAIGADVDYERYDASLNQYLPLGERGVLAPKNGISLRLDIARGRNETIYYVGIGEAF
jgi:hypothetical protein